jgi:methionyl-tRNA formyltransferase
MTKINKTKIIFIGTGEFGLPTFMTLSQEDDFEIVLVITQPDKPAGRKLIITPSPIKIAAEKNNITVLQPEHLADVTEKITLLKPDLIITIAYAQLIPEKILNIPEFGCLNLHASLLPKYRGAAIIPAAILNGDKETGLTIIKMDKGLDTGPILAQIKLNIDKQDTAASLHDKLSKIAPDFLLETIKKYLNGKITLKPQDPNQASYVKILNKGDGLIDWQKNADYIEKFVRAMNPWPVAWTWLDGQQIKIISVQKEPIEINSYKPGKTFKYNSGLAVQCGHDALILKTLQLEGKKALTSQEFINGYKDFVGSVLG